MQCIITIELGTNGVRVFAFDLDGRVIGSMKGYHPTFHTEPDYSEQDPEQIFITTLYLLKNLLNEYIHPKRYKVASICFCASMHSVLAVDKNGNPLGNAITWADNRAGSPGITRLGVRQKPVHGHGDAHPPHVATAKNSLDQTP